MSSRFFNSADILPILQDTILSKEIFRENGTIITAYCNLKTGLSSYKVEWLRPNIDGDNSAETQCLEQATLIAEFYQGAHR